jgi:Zn-dependent M28 family amino/carboxypeptidase
VIADLKGSEHPEQIVIVSGHLDSWDLGTGAIDDAAGVAIAMQAAQLCRQLGLTPRRTLRVIAWMNEENGGSGSRRYVAEYEASLAAAGGRHSEQRRSLVRPEYPRRQRERHVLSFWAPQTWHPPTPGGFRYEGCKIARV